MSRGAIDVDGDLLDPLGVRGDKDAGSDVAVEMAGLGVDLARQQGRAGTVLVHRSHHLLPRGAEPRDERTDHVRRDAGLVGHQDHRRLAVVVERVQRRGERCRLTVAVGLVPDDPRVMRQGQGRRNRNRVVPGHDHDLIDARFGQRVDRVLCERFPVDDDDLFRPAEPRSGAGREHDPRDHGTTTWASARRACGRSWR